MVEQLKAQVLNLVHESNMAWNDELKRCAELGLPFEYSKVVPVISKGVNVKLEQIFAEFQERNKGKKGWF